MSEPELNSELVHELRATKPAAPTELRDRVGALGEPAPRRALPRLSARRAVLVLAPTAVAAGIGLAVVHGLFDSGSSARRASAAKRAERNLLPVPQAAPYSAATGAVGPSLSRLQVYQGSFRIRVSGLDALSRATQRVIATTQRLGGYVVTTRLGSGTARGEATLVVRIPIARVQQAIARFSSLGTIVAQNVSIADVERASGKFQSTITRLRTKIAAELAAGETAKAAADQGRLDALTRRESVLLHRAHFARLAVTLTTKKHGAAIGHQGRLGRTLDDAVSILGREGELLAFASIVLAPFVLLGLAAGLLGRTRGRRVTERLLERA